MNPDDLSKWTDAYLVELVAMDSISLASDARARRWNTHVDRMQRAQLGLSRAASGPSKPRWCCVNSTPAASGWTGNPRADDRGLPYLFVRSGILISDEILLTVPERVPHTDFGN